MTPVGGYNPFGFTYWIDLVFLVNGSGIIDDGNTNGTDAVRPVINIRSDVTITGTGTMTEPYIVN